MTCCVLVVSPVVFGVPGQALILTGDGVMTPDIPEGVACIIPQKQQASSIGRPERLSRCGANDGWLSVQGVEVVSVCVGGISDWLCLTGCEQTKAQSDEDGLALVVHVNGYLSEAKPQQDTTDEPCLQGIMKHRFLKQP